jgi:RNA polymerase sigma-70 factor (ECF subfamily)
MTSERSISPVSEPCGLGFLHLRQLRDEDLMCHLAAGHGDALAILFERYHRLVLSIALKTVRDRSEAQDVTQEVFFQLQRSVTKFDPARGSTKMWIIRAAYRHSLNRREYLSIRSYYNPPKTASDASPEDVIADLNAPEARRLIQQILPKLGRAERRTILWSCFEGMTMQEIAEKTGETVVSVRHHYYRGMKKLRALFPELDSMEVRNSATEVADART